MKVFAKFRSAWPWIFEKTFSPSRRKSSHGVYAQVSSWTDFIALRPLKVPTLKHLDYTRIRVFETKVGATSDSKNFFACKAKNLSGAYVQALSWTDFIALRPLKVPTLKLDHSPPVEDLQLGSVLPVARVWPVPVRSNPWSPKLGRGSPWRFHLLPVCQSGSCSQALCVLRTGACLNVP